MGTHCYIALEDTNDDTIRYMYNHYDGYFSYIFPLLRKYYMERENVEKLISCGNTSSLPHPRECKTNDKEDKKYITVRNRYEFEAIARDSNIEYYYLFTKENKWECQSLNMIDIDDKLNY